MEAWFKTEIEKAKTAGARHILVFQHIPFFRKDANEPERLTNGVDRWARSVWAAYAPLQPLAREWVQQALGK